MIISNLYVVTIYIKILFLVTIVGDHVTLDGALVGVAQVDRLSVIRVHESNKAVNQIRNILERSSLGPVAVNLRPNKKSRLKI